MRDATDIDPLSIDTISLLAADAVQKAKSGHPGAPMGAAPTAYTSWQRCLRYDPAAPGWMNRDRFVPSEGHASMLLYTLIHLAGVKGSREVYGGAGHIHTVVGLVRRPGSGLPRQRIAALDRRAGDGETEYQAFAVIVGLSNSAMHSGTIGRGRIGGNMVIWPVELPRFVFGEHLRKPKEPH
jgi:Transketolase, thiamine diphosphate binding domain